LPSIEGHEAAEPLDLAWPVVTWSLEGGEKRKKRDEHIRLTIEGHPLVVNLVKQPAFSIGTDYPEGGEKEEERGFRSPLSDRTKSG